MAASPTIAAPVVWEFDLDAGSAFSGAVVNPFYDSMLVKVTARGKTLAETASRMERCLQEFRIRGVKTNIPFLIQVIGYDLFLTGECDHAHDRYDAESIRSADAT